MESEEETESVHNEDDQQAQLEKRLAYEKADQDVYDDRELQQLLVRHAKQQFKI